MLHRNIENFSNNKKGRELDEKNLYIIIGSIWKLEAEITNDVYWKAIKSEA
jgi:hypothetical protein